MLKWRYYILRPILGVIWVLVVIYLLPQALDPFDPMKFLVLLANLIVAVGLIFLDRVYGWIFSKLRKNS